jgi:uncharacterized protein (TIGR01244 family)
MRRAVSSLALLLPVALAGCGGAAAGPGPEPRAEAIAFGELVEPGLRAGGRPSESDLRALAEAGYRTVISLRTEEEPGAEAEARLVEQLGMDFVRIPVAGPEEVTADNARQLDAALDAAERPVLVHCSTRNRTGALLGLRAFVGEGASSEEAIARAREAGMTTLEPALRDALERAESQAPPARGA